MPLHDDGTRYFVCASLRSGSTLFCEGLAATGVAGRPAEFFEDLLATNMPRQPREFFLRGELDAELDAMLPPNTRRDEPALLPGPTYAEHLCRVREAGRTENGVWGAKLMCSYLDDLVARLRSVGATSPVLPRHLVLEHHFPGARYLRILREDRIGQAVSLWKAIQTQSWRAGVGASEREPVYHRGAIAHLIGWLGEEERGWDRFFAEAGFGPVTFTYEELVADFSGTVGRTLDALGIALAPGAELPAPPLARQADERSLEWAERFAREHVPA